MASVITRGDGEVKFHQNGANSYQVAGQSREGLTAAHHEEYEGDENEERGNWSGKLDFILSCLGYAVGLGNVWRFPYLVGKNGGGAFLIPYAIMLTFIGLPIFFLELSIGQFSSRGPVTVWECSPLFKGIGWGMMAVSMMIGLEYNLIITWTLYYMFAGFQSVLPWSMCNQEWNNLNCKSSGEEEACVGQENGTHYYFRSQCHTEEEMTLALRSLQISAEPQAAVDFWVQNQSESSSSQYFNRRMLRLHKSEGIDDLGEINWDVCLCLLLAWIIVFLCLIKGIKSSGKVVYFTATFPYVVLVILLVRGATLPGAMDGVKFYMSADWSKLSEPTIWSDAAGQIFFSLSCGMGGLMTLASYNRFRTNVVRDTMIVVFGNCLTSFFAGFVIFSILGFMAKSQGTTVDEVAASGTGLAFIAYPEVVTKLPPAPLWSFIFFFMLLTLGLDSQFAMIETVATGFLDLFPKYRHHKTLVMLGLCIVGFILGLCMVTNGGIFVQYLMDSFAAGWSLVVIALCEVLVVSYVYGLRRFCRDIEMMIDSKVSMFFKAMWFFFTPLVLIFVLVFTFVAYKPLSFGSGIYAYDYPDWAQGIGWIMALISVIMIPLFAIVGIVKNRHEGGSVFQVLHFLTKPTHDWGPALDKFRTGDYKPLGNKHDDTSVHYSANGH